jgi:CHAD domain-containing protein
VVLKAADGATAAQIARALKVTPNTVERALKQFEAKRLEALPRPALFVDELLTAARVDMAHAQQVAAHAVQLFDLTQAIHQLPRKLRALVETGALLHNVGVEIDEPKHHTAGREALMSMKLVGHSEAEQAMLACCIRFHRKTVKPEKEPLFTALTEKQQAHTLALAALVRIADGLDYSQTQTTRIENLALTGQTLALTLAGPHAESDGARAVEDKADVWQAVFGHTWTIAQKPLDVAALAQTPLTAQSLTSDVVWRALADQLQRWQAAEPAARAGEPLGIKNIRAAARRARAALELFRPFLKKKNTKPARQLLKAAEEALGPRRDWDVLLEHAEKEVRGQSWQFVEDWKKERDAAQVDAARWLASAEVRNLSAALTHLLSERPARGKRNLPLAANAEFLLLSPLADLRTLAEELQTEDLETYHRLRRVGVKRTRFMLEFLSSALVEPAQTVLKDLIKVQDRLGKLNDVCVARARAQDWLDANAHADEAARDQARRYILSCERDIRKHLSKFPAEWQAAAPDALEEKLRGLLGALVAPSPPNVLNHPV